MGVREGSRNRIREKVIQGFREKMERREESWRERKRETERARDREQIKRELKTARVLEKESRKERKCPASVQFLAESNQSVTSFFFFF